MEQLDDDAHPGLPLRLLCREIFSGRPGCNFNCKVNGRCRSRRMRIRRLLFVEYHTAVATGTRALALRFRLCSRWILEDIITRIHYSSSDEGLIDR